MDYKDVNDYELIYRIRENDDEDSVNVLVKKYEPLIARCASKYYVKAKYYGVELSDLIQEGRIAVMKALNSYDADNTTLFYTYVTVCINRHLITYCRNLSSNKHIALNCNVGDECLDVFGDLRYEPFSCLNFSYDEDAIKEKMYALDFIDSNIFELRYNGFSYKEIGELLGVSNSIVSRRLCKIRKTLQVIKDKF